MNVYERIGQPRLKTLNALTPRESPPLAMGRRTNGTRDRLELGRSGVARLVDPGLWRSRSLDDLPRLTHSAGGPRFRCYFRPHA